ncbi:hypothetical protein [uncultured Microscilla sp.]|uniref:hypothetical protein n=1 Tax=uncultured Microscilla sp. TaxID=432653 RepID=UPI0026242C7F|nr:hypothetical protein [uncultured Microscilla sp.]
MIEIMIVINCALFFGANSENIWERGATPAIYIFSVVAFFLVLMFGNTDAVNWKSFLLLLFSPLLVNLPFLLVEFCRDYLIPTKKHQPVAVKNTIASKLRAQWLTMDNTLVAIRQRFDHKKNKAELFLTKKRWFLTKQVVHQKIKGFRGLEKEMRLLLAKQKHFIDHNLASLNASYRTYFRQKSKQSASKLKKMMSELAAFAKSFIAHINNADLYDAQQAYQHKGDSIWAEFDPSREDDFWQEYEALLAGMKTAVQASFSKAS